MRKEHMFCVERSEHHYIFHHVVRSASLLQSCGLLPLDGGHPSDWMHWYRFEGTGECRFRDTLVMAHARFWSLFAISQPTNSCFYVIQNAPKAEKGKWMHRHKSLGLLTGMIVAPRFAYRLFKPSAYNVAPVLGAGTLEHMAGKVTHYGLYAFMTIMPASGIAMGYYGGKGLPFFFTTLPGASEKNGGIAKNVSGMLLRCAVCSCLTDIVRRLTRSATVLLGSQAAGNLRKIPRSSSYWWSVAALFPRAQNFHPCQPIPWPTHVSSRQ
jgi:cytochrome b561